MKIMFICTGNICRSAMAHVMLEQEAKLHNKKVEVYSCGIYAEDGDRPTEEAISVLKTIYNVDLTNHRATNIENSPIQEMNVILCATTSHKNNVLNKYPKLKEKKTILDKLSYSFLPQSISFNPSFFKNSFVLENGLLPKKPYLAENGLGWGEVII